jgi:hypothetical protein
MCTLDLFASVLSSAFGQARYDIATDWRTRNQAAVAKTIGRYTEPRQCGRHIVDDIDLGHADSCFGYGCIA